VDWIIAMKKVDFGPSSAGEYFGSLVIPAHQQFLRISNLENAMATARALWETVGWLWLDRNPGVDRRKAPADAQAFDADIFRRCPDLKLFRDLADAAKHGGQLSNPNVTVTGLSGSGSPGGTIFTTTMFGTHQSTPECTLRIEHAGGSRDMTEALATAFKFLQAETS
jgi:hypothetical protein